MKKIICLLLVGLTCIGCINDVKTKYPVLTQYRTSVLAGGSGMATFGFTLSAISLGKAIQQRDKGIAYAKEFGWNPKAGTYSGSSATYKDIALYTGLSGLLIGGISVLYYLIMKPF